jgi:hypothetical protein
MASKSFDPVAPAIPVAYAVGAVAPGAQTMDRDLDSALADVDSESFTQRWVADKLIFY